MGKEWYEESSQELATGFTEVPPQTAKIVETRHLDEQSQAWVMDNGQIVIQGINGVEVVLGPERAYALLDLLNAYRDLLDQKTHEQEGQGQQ